jgi:hypothetical protein
MFGDVPSLLRRTTQLLKFRSETLKKNTKYLTGSGIVLAPLRYRRCMMRPIFRTAYVCLLPLTLTAAGCESISLISRPDPYARDERRDRDRERNLDRSGEVRRDQDWDRSRNEIAGTVQRVDPDRQEIELRAADGGLTRVRYDISTRVSYRDRDMRVEELRYGDLVRVELSRDRGERYAERIRMGDRADVGSRR